MEMDFSTPQRQAPIGVLVMFFDTIRQFSAALWPILVFWIFRIDEINRVLLILGIVGVFLFVSLVAYFKYLNFTFWLDNVNAEFIISEGIFNKTKTVIQLNKIQQVNLTQSLIQRIINVYAIDVDTAGSTKKEGKIKAVSHTLAIALKERLLDNEKIIANSEPADLENLSTTEAKPFIKIGFLSLLKVGITSNYIKSFWLLVVFFGSIYENLRHFGSSVSYAKDKMNSIEEVLIVQSVGVIAMGFLIIILLINVIRTIVRYFNYNITRQSGSLLLSYGLINTKSTIIKPEKVQITSVTRNYFQKKMNVTELKISQAASGEKQEKNASIEIPGCDNNERDAILTLLFEIIPEKGYMLTPNWRKLVFSLFLIIVLPLSVFYLAGGYNLPSISNYLGIIPLSALFAAAMIYFGYRNYRLYINDRFIIKQSGAWDISNDIIEPGKIQAITTSQLFWHKNLNIGSLTIHTAGGNLSFSLGNYNSIKEFVNLWLYEIETSDSNWM